MYHIFLAVAFVCFLYHTVVHVLEHYKKISENKFSHIGIEISMFLGWLSYFFVSFSNFSFNLSILNYLGLVVLITGFYLFFASSKKVHKKLHTGKGGLVTEGIYKYTRHPMYLGEILMLISAPVFGSSLLTFGLSPIFIIQILIWRHYEEKELLSEFPKEYAEYKNRTWF